MHSLGVFSHTKMRALADTLLASSLKDAVRAGLFLFSL